VVVLTGTVAVVGEITMDLIVAVPLLPPPQAASVNSAGTIVADRTNCWAFRSVKGLVSILTGLTAHHTR
jgi:hypothetical protein